MMDLPKISIELSEESTTCSTPTVASTRTSPPALTTDADAVTLVQMMLAALELERAQEQIAAHANISGRARSKSEGTTTTTATHSSCPAARTRLSGQTVLPPLAPSFSETRSFALPPLKTDSPPSSAPQYRTTTSSGSLLTPSVPNTAYSLASPAAETPGLSPGLIRSFPLPPSGTSPSASSEGTVSSILPLTPLSPTPAANTQPLRGTVAAIVELYKGEDEDRTPTDSNAPVQPDAHITMTSRSMNEHDLHARDRRISTASMPGGLAGAFTSSDSLESAVYVGPSNEFREATSDNEGNDEAFSTTHRPSVQRHHSRRSQRSISTVHDTPSEDAAKRSKRAAPHKKRSKASLRSAVSNGSLSNQFSVDEDQHQYHPQQHSRHSYPGRRSSSSGPASPSTRSFTHGSPRSRSTTAAALEAIPPRPASRASWRSRYSRPDTALSMAASSETMYEDARERFSGDEADAEEDEESANTDRAIEAALTSSGGDRSISATSSSSTLRAQESLPSRSYAYKKLSFQRRRTPSPLEGSSGSTASAPSSDAGGHHQPYKTSGRLRLSSGGLGTHSTGANALVASSTASSPASSPPPDVLADSRRGSASSMSTVSLAHDNARHSLPSGYTVQASRYLPRQPTKQQTRERGYSSTSEDGASAQQQQQQLDRDRASSSSALGLRPLMLTPEKTPRGSLKDWSMLPISKSALQQLQHLDDPVSHFREVKNPRHRSMDCPDLDQELLNPRSTPSLSTPALSPDLDSEATFSPFSAHSSSYGTISGATTPTSAASSIPSFRNTAHSLPPVAEESYVATTDEDNDDEGAASGSTANAQKQSSGSSGKRQSRSGKALLHTKTHHAHSQHAETLTDDAQRHWEQQELLDVRKRSMSIASSAFSQPTFTSNITGYTANSAELATLEVKQHVSFDSTPAAYRQIPTPAVQTAPRQRTRSQPLVPQARAGGVQHQRGQSQEEPMRLPPQELTDEQRRTDELVQQLMPLNWTLRRQYKAGNSKPPKSPTTPKSTTKSKMPPPVGYTKPPSDKPTSSVPIAKTLFGALKKRKSSPETRSKALPYNGGELIPLPDIKLKTISAPLHAVHLCTGALNPHPNREDPFGRRPASPVQGYINVPYADSLYMQDGVIHSYDGSGKVAVRAASGNIVVSAVPQVVRQVQLEHQARPGLASSPMSSSSSHDDNGPPTPTAASSLFDSDFWAVSFAEAQAGDQDFVAPHAALSKAGKVAHLTTNEKARRRASKASTMS